MSATLNGARRYHSPYISLLTPSVESFGAPSDVGLLEDTSFVRWLVMPAVSRYLSAPAGAQRQSMTTRKDLQSDFQDFAFCSTPSGLGSIPDVHVGPRRNGEGGTV